MTATNGQHTAAPMTTTFSMTSLATRTKALHDELGRRVARAYRRGDLDDLAADLSPEQVENVRVIIHGTAAGVITTAELVAATNAGTVIALADLCRDRLAVQR